MGDRFVLPASRRRLVVATIAVLALAACGAAPDVTTSDQATTAPGSTAPGSSVSASSEPAGTMASVVEPEPEPTSPETIVPDSPPSPVATSVDPGESDVDPGELTNCGKVPAATTEIAGSAELLTRGLDPVFQGVLLTYAADHPDTFAGLWLDREAGGVVVMAFVGDPEPHRLALAARAPTPNDVSAVDPPLPITDARPIGEWGVPFDVVGAEFSEADLQVALQSAYSAAQQADVGVDSSGIDVQRNRVALYPSGPMSTSDYREMRAAVEASGTPIEMVCFSGEVVDVVPEPIAPGTPLDVIVLPDAAGSYPPETPVSCSGVGFTLGDLQNLTPVDEIDDDLRAVLDSWISGPEESGWPPDGWLLLFEDGERAQFVNIAPDGVSWVGAEMARSGWIWSGASSGGRCAVVRQLPEGLGVVEWELDPDHPAPDPTSTELHLLATERACTGAAEMGERLLGPQVVESADAVRVAFAAIPLTGGQTCPGNPSTPVTVQLESQLGERALLDGMLVGPLGVLVDAG